MEEVNPNLSEKALRDYEAVKRARAGDNKAFEELHDRYRDTIFYMVLRIVNNASDAEDLTIEAFGKAFNNIDQYVPRYAFSSWLFRIAKNNCIDFIRCKKSSIVDYDSNVYVHMEGSTLTATVPAKIEDPEEKLIAMQSVHRVREIIAKLRPRYRRLVQLRYFKEYSYDEIAEELGLPMGTVKAQLYRAREMLQKILKDFDNPDV